MVRITCLFLQHGTFREDNYLPVSNFVFGTVLQMKLETLREQANRYLDSADESQLGCAHPVEGLMLFRRLKATPCQSTLYEPVVCLILQGGKEITAGDVTVQLHAGQSMVVSHDIPLVYRIIEADPGSPYLGVVVTLDIKLLRGLYEEVGGLARNEESASSLAVHETDPKILDNLSRYLALADDPLDEQVLLAQVRRELHYRLLAAPHGAMLRKLQHHGSTASNMARAIAYIRRNYRASIPIQEVAKAAGMSPSSLHNHFRQVTQTTPLQFQKDLRLLEARQALHSGAETISSIAFAVGYESASQFSREYTRKFGMAPRDDRKHGTKSAP